MSCRCQRDMVYVSAGILPLTPHYRRAKDGNKASKADPCFAIQSSRLSARRATNALWLRLLITLQSAFFLTPRVRYADFSILRGPFIQVSGLQCRAANADHSHRLLAGPRWSRRSDAHEDSHLPHRS